MQSPDRQEIKLAGWKMIRISWMVLGILLASRLVALAASPAPAPTNATSGLFSDYADRVVQVRVVEQTSGVKSAIGSGFAVSADGEIVTNYHVVSKLVFEHERYGLEVVNHQDQILPGRLVYVDVIHDLAVVQTTHSFAKFFTPAELDLPKGTPVYAFGNPHDLGLTIVEGLYNGFVDHTRYEKIHYTGSLNSGMSGGPAISASGNLVGVNVSSMGNQVSFLVPATFVVNLLQSYHQAADSSPPNLMKLVEQQLLADQQLVYTELFARDVPRIDLSPYKIPSQLLPAHKCWSNAKSFPKRRYQYVYHQCSFSDDIYLTSDFDTGRLYVNYTLTSSEQLNPFQFADLLETDLKGRYVEGSEKYVTNFRCINDFVETNTTTHWVNACFRAYKQLPSLYDVVVVGSSLQSEPQSLLSYLEATGISFANAQQLIKYFLGGISWTKP